GTPALDLPAGAIALLNKLKIEVSTDLAACTYESTSLFSHRGFMNRGEAPGRTAGLVWVTKPS
ncbi:laccase domain-containing protein, partial [Acetobacter fabarum]